MAEIKLTPEELLAQSAEFASLQSEYEALFAQVTTVLNGMNENWSENLARNFSGKIQSAQKKFSSVTNMLTNGAAAARMSASTFATPSEILSQLEGTFDKASDKLNQWMENMDGNKLQTILTEEEQQQLINMLPKEVRESAEKAGNIEAWLAKNYDELPEETRKALESVLPSEVKGTIELVHDVMQGNADMDTLGKATELVTGDPLTGNVVQSAFEAVFNERLKDNPELMQTFDMKSEQAYDAFKNHDYLSGAGYFSEAFVAKAQNDLGKFGYAFGDTVTNMAGHAIEGLAAVPDALSKVAGAVPGDLGDTLQKGVKFVGDARNAVGKWFHDLM